VGIKYASRRNDEFISGGELRTRIRRLGLTYRRAAELLGLTLDGLNKQMRNARPVSRQTVLLLGYLEKYPPPRPVKVTARVTKVRLSEPAPPTKAEKPAKPVKPRRARSLARFLY
jgi:hypothetical protein